MFDYEKRLQYPIKIKNPDPAMAKFIISQYGGPHGEIGASLRYLSQRYTMPYEELRAALNDIGTEELSHFEMVGTIVHQLTRGLKESEIKTVLLRIISSTTPRAFIRLRQAARRFRRQLSHPPATR